jgi:2-keto-4-pentenoate hydratase/2-oxohepta-3-ene-1,7-dioic acid hydratase in catechol pathway
VRICRYREKTDGSETARLGVVIDGTVADVSAVAAALPAMRWPVPPGDAFVAALDELRPELARLAADAPRTPLGDVVLLSPVARPHRLICAVGNFPEQAAAKGRRPDEQGLLFKVVDRPVGAGEGLVLRLRDRPTLHEVELVAVIGRVTSGVTARDALAGVAGYAIGLDMTVDGPEYPSLRKSPDGYAVIGPWLVTADELGEPGDLTVTLAVNGETRQRDSTARLVLGVAELVALASTFMTLHPGDMIFAGNPDGSRAVVAGDRILAEIDRIGRMEVAVRAGG